MRVQSVWPSVWPPSEKVTKKGYTNPTCAVQQTHVALCARLQSRLKPDWVAVLLVSVFENRKLTLPNCFAPAYSPDYNPIEYYFSMLKRIVRKWRLQDMVRGRQRGFEELVPLAVREIKKEDVNKCIEHVYKLYNLWINFVIWLHFVHLPLKLNKVQIEISKKRNSSKIGSQKVTVYYHSFAINVDCFYNCFWCDVLKILFFWLYDFRLAF